MLYIISLEDPHIQIIALIAIVLFVITSEVGLIW